MSYFLFIDIYYNSIKILVIVCFIDSQTCITLVTAYNTSDVSGNKHVMVNSMFDSGTYISVAIKTFCS